jgi:PHD/YefM family antitoxin component YafN of YafNO toxin-antitoxin module
MNGGGGYQSLHFASVGRGVLERGVWGLIWGWGQGGGGVGGDQEDADLVLDQQELGLPRETVMKRIFEMKLVGEQLGEILEQVKTKPVWITDEGVDVAVMISPELFEALVEAEEDLEDIAAVAEALKDKTPGIPWEQVKKYIDLKD